MISIRCHVCKILFPDTLLAVKLVATVPAVKRAHLADGIALVLQLGHRMSIDHDFFTQVKFDENLVTTEFLRLPKFKEDQRALATVFGSGRR